MQRRTWTADEKLAIVLAGLKQTQSVAELCREHQISQTQYYKWRDAVSWKAANRLSMGAKHDATKQLERKVEQLEQHHRQADRGPGGAKKNFQLDERPRCRSWLRW